MPFACASFISSNRSSKVYADVSFINILLISAEEITCRGRYCLKDITQDDDYENYDETEFLHSYVKKELDKEQYMREEILAHDSLIEMNEEDTLQGWLIPVLVFCAFAVTYFVCTGISSLIGG